MSDAATIRRSKHCSALGAWESVARRPAPGLSNMLQSYVGFRGRLELRRELHLPSGAPAVVVNFGAPFRIESGAVAGGDWCDDVSVMGPHDRPFVTETPNDRDILIVNLTPAGAHRLLGAPMSELANRWTCLLYTSPSPRDRTRSRMPSSA